MEPLPLKAPTFVPTKARTKWKHLVELGLASELSLQDTVLFGNLCSLIIDLEKAMDEQKRYYNDCLTEETEAKGMSRRRNPYVEVIRNLRDQILVHCKNLGMTPATRKHLSESNLVKPAGQSARQKPTPENEGDADFTDIEEIIPAQH